MIEWYSSLFLMILFPVILAMISFKWKSPLGLLVGFHCLAFTLYALDLFPWYFWGLPFLIPWLLILLWIFFRHNSEGRLKSIHLLPSSLVILGLLIWLYYPRGVEATLSSPFPKGQSFVIFHGGNSPHHQRWHRIKSEYHYALDIIPRNSWYQISTSFWPENNADFIGVGTEIISPCEATVIKSWNKLSNNQLDQPVSEAIPGNHLYLQCSNGLVVKLEHMGEGSALFKAGEKIKPGQKVGVLGNTGLSYFPHLHIHVLKNGEPIPFRLN